MTDPTPSKLAEAKKLLKKFYKDFSGIDNEVKDLLAAQDLISYGRGREEQKKADIEIIRRDTNEFLLDQGYSNEEAYMPDDLVDVVELFQKDTIEKINNPISYDDYSRS